MYIYKRLIAGLLIGLSQLALAGGPAAPAAIKGPVALIVPYPAGGASDITARILAGPIGQALDVPVVVENIGGATGAIAIHKLLEAPADGRALYQGSQNELILPPLTVKSTRYLPDDVQIVHPVTTTRLVLVVRQGLPVRDLQEFMELARKRKDTDPFAYGSPGTASLYHLLSESMAEMAGVTFNHIPYKGSAPLMQDLIGERIDFTVMAFSTTMMPFVRDGRYRILANFSRDKPRELAELPSVSDVVVFKDLDYTSNAGYYVRRGTPQAVRERLNLAIGNAISSAAVVKSLEDDGRRVSSRVSISQAEDLYRAEVAKYRKMANRLLCARRSAGIERVHGGRADDTLCL